MILYKFFNLKFLLEKSKTRRIFKETLNLVEYSSHGHALKPVFESRLNNNFELHLHKSHCQMLILNKNHSFLPKSQFFKYQIQVNLWIKSVI